MGTLTNKDSFNQKPNKEGGDIESIVKQRQSNTPSEDQQLSEIPEVFVKDAIDADAVQNFSKFNCSWSLHSFKSNRDELDAQEEREKAQLRKETEEISVELDSLEISPMRSNDGQLGSPERPRD